MHDVITYDLQTKSENQKFIDAITRLPQSTPIKPWVSLDSSSILAEAEQLGIYEDKSQKYVQEAKQLGFIKDKEELKTVVIEYPWMIYNRFVRVPVNDMLYAINYSRNAYILNEYEQKLVSNIKVGIAGLSVGGVAGTLLVKLGFQNIIGIDGGLVDGKDLNRSGFGKVPSVALPHAHAFKMACLEINPFAKIKTSFSFLGGNGYSIKNFVNECDIIIEEVDALDVKWDIRVEAKKQGKMVAMGTDLGSGSLLQIEHPDTPPFFGRVDEKVIQAYKSNPDNHHLKTRIAYKMIGGKNNIPRHYIKAIAESRQQKLGYWPQVGEAAYLTASLLSKGIRKSLMERDKSIELLIDLEEVIDNSTLKRM